MPMWLALTAAMLASATDPATGTATGTPPAADPSAADHSGGTQFKSARTLDQLEQCLTKELSEVGEVVAVHTGTDTTTLVLRNVPGGPMTIDLAPPLVTVTSHFLTETRELVGKCI